MRDLIPRMHGATSIWISAFLLSLFEMDFIEYMASISILFAVNSGHYLIFRGSTSLRDYVIIALSIILIGLTSPNNTIILAYAFPLFLSVIFRDEFRKYVIFASVLTTIPAIYASDLIKTTLFTSFAISSVFTADSIIYRDKRTAIIGVLLYSLVSAMLEPKFILGVVLLLIPSLMNFRTKTLGLYLLSALLFFSLIVKFTV